MVARLSRIVSAVRPDAGEDGFTLIELMVSTLVLTVVSGIVLQGMFSLSQINTIVANRTEMHAGVRNATELLQQEVGQAGRVALPGTPTLTAAVGAGAGTVTVSSTTGMFVGERLTIDIGANEETVALTAVDGGAGTITATFVSAHAAGSRISASGAFTAGIVPTTTANGSTGTVMKIIGDVNGDSQVMYVEYTCDLVAGRLYRNPMAFTAGAKVAPTVEQVLLDNVLPNPDGTPCFTYQQRSVNGTTFVVGVAITLTVRTNDLDPITGQFQRETKALLNVSPRNVFNVWQTTSLGYTNRAQPIPPSVQVLMP